jgi:hypothetical protein
MPNFRDIPQITRGASYRVDVSWHYLVQFYHGMVHEYGLDVNPNFQRGRVWALDQKVKYVEYILMGGKSGKEIYTNAPGWHTGRVGHGGENAWFVLVDGKQRLDAVLGFMNNEFPIFGGNYRRDYEDAPDIMSARFSWHVNELPTMAEVYRWYIDLNTGGTPHSPDDIARVQVLLDAKAAYTRPTQVEVEAAAGLEREVIQAYVKEKAEKQREADARNAEREAKEALKPKRKVKGRK